MATLAAVVIVGGKYLLGRTQETTTNTSREKIQVIEFNGKQIPITEVVVGTGPDCDSDHYHAADGTSVQAVDGAAVPDPGGCGYGKVSEVTISEI